MKRGFVSAGPLVAAMSFLAAGCGKEGPPLPPLHVVPGPVTNVVARLQANQMRISFALPTRNENADGPVNLERVEIFAATVAAGAAVPSNRELLSAVNRAGVIEVEPPPAKEGAPAAAKDDPRPSPGDTVTFTEELTEARLKPTYTKAAPKPPAGAPAAAAAAAGAAASPAAPAFPKRVYAIRGVARGGRPGQPTTRIEVPLIGTPPPPAALQVTYSESAMTLAWLPPVLEGAPPPAFNVYVPEATAPLNPAPLTSPGFERQGVEFGKEECFIVRAVWMVGTLALESAASERVCATPADTFAPAAPRGLSAVASAGGISLIWDASTESDLAGYVVLRGEVPGDRLEPITPEPLRETTYVDTTAKPGVRYAYAIVAVDNATPPNRSVPSPRVEETAR